MRLVGFSAVLAVFALATPGASEAHADTLECGDVVTADVTLNTSMTGCSDGLVLGAPGVTLDLGGHTISGTGTGTGLIIEYLDATVINGSISNFGLGIGSYVNASQPPTPAGLQLTRIDVSSNATGIRLGGQDFDQQWYNAAPPTRVTRSAIHDNGTGIAASAWRPGRTVLEDNRIVRNRGSAYSCFYDCSPFSIRSNAIMDNGGGISLWFSAGGGTLEGNRIMRNDGDGLSATRSPGLQITKNVISMNGGDGAHLSDSDFTLEGNKLSRNGGSGLFMSDTVDWHRPDNVLTGNVAEANGAWGIASPHAGWGNGGGNLARKNGEPLQCLNFDCELKQPRPRTPTRPLVAPHPVE